MAAATATFPASMSSTFPQYTRRSNLAYQPFDADLLARKLEAHRCAQLIKSTQPANSAQRKESDAAAVASTITSAKRASYVPRSAAAQFASTTTPMNKRPASPPYQRTYSINQQQPDMFVSPKHMRISSDLDQDNDMTCPTSEVTYAAIAVVDAAPKRLSTTSKQSLSPRQQSLSADDSRAATSNASARGYRPGDAARRNAIKRHSQIVPMPYYGTSQHAMERASHGSEFRNTLIDLDEDEDVAVTDRKHSAADSAMGSDGDDSSSEDIVSHAVRGEDRPDWSQSDADPEAGNSIGLRIPSLRRRKDSEEQQQFNAQRTRTASAPEQRLVGDAVKAIKKDQKHSRRESVMGFFKRF